MATNVNSRWLHPGFTRDSVLNYLFKKGINRVDTSQNTTYYQEEFGNNSIFLDNLATDPIPHDVPTDFVKLTRPQIAEVFGISEAEVDEFNSTIDGVSAFSVEQSSENPHILRINNLLMKPYIRSINNTFTGFSSKSRVNLVANTIHSSFGNGGYKCAIKRSGLSGELSLRGSDIVNLHHIAYIFDSDNGILVLHEPDDPTRTPNPINNKSPPVFSCYVYRGSFGRLGWQVKNNALILNQAQLLLGKSTMTDPGLILDVSGSAFIENITAESIATFSDIRLKENIDVAPVNKDIIDLHPVLYNYKSKPGVKEFGLIAQEVQKVAPEIVKELGDHLTVQYDRIGVFLIPIVKEQQERIALLESRLDAAVKIIEKMGGGTF